MTLAEGLEGLVRVALVLTLLIPLLALLRPWLLRLAGPHLTYAAWLLVPLAVMMSLWPWSDDPRMAEFRLALPSPTGLLGLPSGVDAQAWPALPVLAWVWLVGAAVTALGLARAQRNYVAGLQMQPGVDGVWRARAAHAVPALVGAWRPRLVLPLDFEQRYSAGQQRLILAHEAEHARRRDPLVQLLACGLRVLWWFHPLVHWAHVWLRRDQELACDHAVLARHPGQRRAYAEALLITQLDRPGLPVGCTWRSSHPLKERLVMLKRPAPSAPRRWIARGLLVCVATGLSLFAWAAGPAGEHTGAAGVPGVMSRPEVPRMSAAETTQGLIATRDQSAARPLQSPIVVGTGASAKVVRAYSSTTVLSETPAEALPWVQPILYAVQTDDC